MASQCSGDGDGPVHALRLEDLRATARLHREELPDGFFADLGPRFLVEYHRTYVVSPHAIALTVRTGDVTDGFLLAVLDPAAHGAWVLRRSGARLAVVGALALAVRPRLLAVFLRTRLLRYARGLWRRARRVAPPQQGGRERGWAVLSHIAVAAERRGTGAGAALVGELHRRALVARAAGIVLLTDPAGPGPGFYERLGYEGDGLVAGADGSRWLRFRHPLVR